MCFLFIQYNRIHFHWLHTWLYLCSVYRQSCKVFSIQTISNFNQGSCGKVQSYLSPSQGIQRFVANLQKAQWPGLQEWASMFMFSLLWLCSQGESQFFSFACTHAYSICDDHTWNILMNKSKLETELTGQNLCCVCRSWLTYAMSTLNWRSSSRIKQQNLPMPTGGWRATRLKSKNYGWGWRSWRKSWARLRMRYANDFMVLMFQINSQKITKSLIKLKYSNSLQQLQPSHNLKVVYTIIQWRL